jgi:hypothetical protein
MFLPGPAPSRNTHNAWFRLDSVSLGATSRLPAHNVSVGHVLHGTMSRPMRFLEACQ